jgi:hypothetical protein
MLPVRDLTAAASLLLPGLLHLARLPRLRLLLFLGWRPLLGPLLLLLLGRRRLFLTQLLLFPGRLALGLNDLPFFLLPAGEQGKSDKGAKAEMSFHEGLLR